MMTENEKNIDEKEEVKTSRRFGVDQGHGRLFFLILLSLALTNLGFDRMFGLGQYFGLLSFLAPVPLTIATLIYGRKKTLGGALVLVTILGLLTFVSPNMGMIAAAYFFTTLYAFLVTKVIENDLSPFRGIFVVGITFVILLWAMIFGYNTIYEGGMLEYIRKAVELSLAQVPNQKIDPKVLIDYIYTMGPVYLTIAPFLALWACFFLVLRNAIFWRSNMEYSYSSKDMTAFRTPFYLVYLLVVGLGLSLAANHFEMKNLELLGSITLGLVGIFYFFQGFGVFLDSLNHFKVMGFMRSFFIVFAVLLAQVWLAALGVFDTWFDFREFFKRKMNEGDIK